MSFSSFSIDMFFFLINATNYVILMTIVWTGISSEKAFFQKETNEKEICLKFSTTDSVAVESNDFYLWNVEFE